MLKLLLIDDEEPIRIALGRSLRSDGYEVLTAEDGKVGIEVFKKENPPIVLTDMKMPGMDGLEVLKNIKEINPEAEVIVVTGHGDIDIAIQSLQLDASDFITKPVTDEALSVALRRARERLDIRRKLKEYTDSLEDKVKEATAELRERYEFEANLIQHSIDGIIATDKQENIIIFNQGAESIFGYSKDEVIGKMDIRSLYPPEIAEEVMLNLYSKKHKNNAIHRWRETFVLGEGGHKIPVRFSGSILHRNGEVIGSVGFFNDLREIKRLEHELIKSERLAATGQTVAGLAHCIKNMVVALEGGVDIVNTALEKNNISNLSIGWDLVQRNIGKVSSLVLDLLSFSKDRNPEYEKCSPNIIADEVCDLMDSKVKKCDIEIARDFDPNMGEASLDPKGIHRCLLNLVSNAVDACMSDKDENKEHLLRMATRRGSNGMITFQVSDNGCGMAEEVRRQIFTSFFSTKGSKGTGLGLLITQKIVQEHGGTIKVKSEAGAGTSFELKFPARL